MKIQMMQNVYQLTRHEADDGSPLWTPDGKQIIFCSEREGNLSIFSIAASGTEEAEQIAYIEDSYIWPFSLSNDGKTLSFGHWNLLDGYNIGIHSMDGAHAPKLLLQDEYIKSYPRISPDGKFIMFTMSDFGCFPSFNPEADLWILNLENNEYYNVDAVNSNYTESYHSWSSDGHWVVFSSRRIDGLYMNIYFAFVDEDGSIRKPFLLPQRNPDFYDKFLFSFNIPEFVTKKVGIDPYEIEKVAKSGKIPV